MTLRVEVPIGTGETVLMPIPQVQTLGQLAKEHPGSRWHFADCGCCVCFHPGGDTSRGWLIGADGESDYYKGAHA